MPAFLIYVNLGGDTGACQLGKELRGANGVAGIRLGDQQERRREVLERFSRSDASRPIDQAQVVRTRVVPVRRVCRMGISGAGRSRNQVTQTRSGREADEADLCRIE